MRLYPLFSVLIAVLLFGIEAPSFAVSKDNLKTALQNAINSGLIRSQIVAWFSSARTDSDFVWDG